MVDAAEIVPIILVNQASETLRMKKGERGRKCLSPEDYTKSKT